MYHNIKESAPQPSGEKWNNKSSAVETKTLHQRHSSSSSTLPTSLPTQHSCVGPLPNGEDMDAGSRAVATSWSLAHFETMCSTLLKDCNAVRIKGKRPPLNTTTTTAPSPVSQQYYPKSTTRKTNTATLNVIHANNNNNSNSVAGTLHTPLGSAFFAEGGSKLSAQVLGIPLEWEDKCVESIKAFLLARSDFIAAQHIAHSSGGEGSKRKKKSLADVLGQVCGGTGQQPSDTTTSVVSAKLDDEEPDIDHQKDLWKLSDILVYCVANNELLRSRDTRRDNVIDVDALVADGVASLTSLLHYLIDEHQPLTTPAAGKNTFVSVAGGTCDGSSEDLARDAYLAGSGGNFCSEFGEVVESRDFIFEEPPSTHLNDGLPHPASFTRRRCSASSPTASVSSRPPPHTSMSKRRTSRQQQHSMNGQEASSPSLPSAEALEFAFTEVPEFVSWYTADGNPQRTLQPVEILQLKMILFRGVINFLLKNLFYRHEGKLQGHVSRSTRAYQTASFTKRRGSMMGSAEQREAAHQRTPLSPHRICAATESFRLYFVLNTPNFHVKMPTRCPPPPVPSGSTNDDDEEQEPVHSSFAATTRIAHDLLHAVRKSEDGTLHDIADIVSTSGYPPDRPPFGTVCTTFDVHMADLKELQFQFAAYNRALESRAPSIDSGLHLQPLVERQDTFTIDPLHVIDFGTFSVSHRQSSSRASSTALLTRKMNPTQTPATSWGGSAAGQSLLMPFTENQPSGFMELETHREEMARTMENHVSSALSNTEQPATAGVREGSSVVAVGPTFCKLMQRGETVGVNCTKTQLQIISNEGSGDEKHIEKARSMDVKVAATTTSVAEDEDGMKKHEQPWWLVDTSSNASARTLRIQQQEEYSASSKLPHAPSAATSLKCLARSVRQDLASSNTPASVVAFAPTNGALSFATTAEHLRHFGLSTLFSRVPFRNPQTHREDDDDHHHQALPPPPPSELAAEIDDTSDEYRTVEVIGLLCRAINAHYKHHINTKRPTALLARFITMTYMDVGLLLRCLQLGQPIAQRAVPGFRAVDGEDFFGAMSAVLHVATAHRSEGGRVSVVTIDDAEDATATLQRLHIPLHSWVLVALAAVSKRASLGERQALCALQFLMDAEATLEGTGFSDAHHYPQNKGTVCQPSHPVDCSGGSSVFQLFIMEHVSAQSVQIFLTQVALWQEELLTEYEVTSAKFQHCGSSRDVGRRSSSSNNKVALRELRRAFNEKLKLIVHVRKAVKPEEGGAASVAGRSGRSVVKRTG